MPEFSRTLVSLFNREAPDQGGLLTGKNPSAYNTSDPLRLWIIQLGVIVSTAALLSLVLRKLHQPKVISEVLGGIILGPTALGAIPHFSDRIFPPLSLPYLSLVANIGLVLFLFLVGLEIDASIIKRNAKLSASIALAGMVIPFGLGAGLSHAIYEKFGDPTVKYTYFMLFTGVAYSITAFPVLARILTELKLLDTTVGIVVLSAGVANDIVGWTLLALSVALVNAGTGLTALYILLICIAWATLLLTVGRYFLLWLARKTGSLENGPTVFFMTIVILMVFASAFFTDIIGVHAIFGAFILGIIVPREGGLNIAMTEKLEDMVAITFLPLYFTISGLNTNLRLLDTGIIWGYTIAICALAFTGKFGGCTLAAHYVAGFNWRESSTIGSLMSCKGLVELIVLNVGLSAGILSQRVFSMFVLEALTLTCMTTPLVTKLYPPHLRVRASTAGANFNNVSDAEQQRAAHWKSLHQGARTRFTFVLDKLEHLPGMMAIAQLIQPNTTLSTGGSKELSRQQSKASSNSSSSTNSPAVSIEALRLMELSDRTSAVMKSSASESLLASDPILAIFRMFGSLHDLQVSTALTIVPFDDFGSSIASQAENSGSEMIVLPWLPTNRHQHLNTETIASETPRTPGPSGAVHHNPFDVLFKAATSGNAQDKSASAVHASFVRSVFSAAKTDVALAVDQTSHMHVTATTGSKQHLFVVFFGGPDDRMALDFAAQLCARGSHVSATLLRLVKKDPEVDDLQTPQMARVAAEKAEEANMLTIASANIAADTVYGHVTEETRLQSDTADNLAWSKFADALIDTSSGDNTDPQKNIEAREISSPIPLHAAIHEVNVYAEAHRQTRVLVVVGRSRRLAVENHNAELKQLVGEYGSVGTDVRKTMGDVASAFVTAGAGDGLVVLQAAKIDD